MFEILRQSLKTGVVTTRYPATPAEVSAAPAAGRKLIGPTGRTPGPPPAICPTGAIAVHGRRRTCARRTLDLGKCIFCGLCAEVDPAIRMTNALRTAPPAPRRLADHARYQLRPDGTHERLLACDRRSDRASLEHARPGNQPNRSTALGGESRSASAGCSAVRCTSAKWTPAPATAAKSKSRPEQSGL